MSNFKCLIVILSFSISFAGNSQQIFDDLSPQVLLDAVKFKDLELRYFTVGTCKGGKLEVVSNQTTVELYNFFTSRAKFKTDSDKWVLLANNMHADDIQGDFITLYSGDEQGLTVEGTRIDGVSFSDFALYNDEIVLISRNSENVLLRLDAMGVILDSIKTLFQPTHIETIGDKLVLISNDTIHLLSEDFTIELSRPCPIPTSYKKYNEELYLLSSDSIVAFSPELDRTLSIALPQDVGAKDITLDQEVLYLVANDGVDSQVYAFNGSTWSVDFNYSDENIILNAFLEGDRDVLYGRFRLPEELYTGVDNAVRINQSDSLPSEDLLEISLDEALEESWIHDIHIYNGDTIVEFRYKYEIKYTVTNVGIDTVDEVLVTSNRGASFNCAWAGLQRLHSDLALAPGESVSFSDEISAGHVKFDEICLYALSANDKVDPVFENNASCSTPTSSTVDYRRSIPYIYPTATSDFIYFSQPSSFSDVKIYDVSGQLFSLHTGREALDVSSLETGIYFLTYSFENRRYTERFLKL